MKNLFAVLSAMLLIFGPTACEDSGAPSSDTSRFQDSSTADSSTDTGDSSEADDAAEDASNVDAEDTSDVESIDVLDDAPEVPEESLPSDPTENPEGEASYYEFPAWHIPPTS